MNRAGDIALLRRAAELLEADATCLRESHNADPLQPDWSEEPDAQAAHDEDLAIAVGLHMLATRIEGDEPAVELAALQFQLAAQRERADYAWRNANVIEKARQEEMAKRDELVAEVAILRHHLTELAKLSDRAALVLVTIEAEDTTEDEMLQEIIDGIQTWVPDAMRGQIAVLPAPTSAKVTAS